MGTVRDLRDFLLEAELEHYYSAFKNELKIASVPQIKYLEEEDLVNIGMTKPEMRRLKKFYKKECPQGKLEKFKRVSFFFFFFFFFLFGEMHIWHGSLA